MKEVNVSLKALNACAKERNVSVKVRNAPANFKDFPTPPANLKTKKEEVIS